MHIVRSLGEAQADDDVSTSSARTFPAGTVSGSEDPGDEINRRDREGEARALPRVWSAYFSYAGGFDSCIAIRSSLETDASSACRRRAGIVYDSDARASTRRPP
jgi:anthranilate synthase component 1